MKKMVILWILLLSWVGIHSTQAQYAEWAFNTVSGNSRVFGSAMDTAGNTIITGHYNSSIILDVIQEGTGFYIAKYDTDGNPIWSRVAGNGNSRGLAVAVDQAGNSFVSGYFQTKITFGTGTSAVTLNTKTHYNAGFIAKYDANGNFLWVQQAGGDDNYEQIREVVVDNLGNCYVMGTVNNTPYLAKYNGVDGTLLWSRTDIKATDISTDGSNIYFVGHLYGVLKLDGLSIESILGTYTIFYGKLNGGTNKVTLLHATHLESSTRPIRLANDANGNGYIMGTGFYGNYTFGADVLAATTDNDNNIFIAKYDSSGNEVWAKKADGIGDPGPAASDVTADTNGVYITGYFHTTLAFGSGITLKGKRTSIKLTKAFTAKYNTGGTIQWARASGGISSERPYRIETNGKGKVNIAGGTSGRGSFECIKMGHASSFYYGFNARYHDDTHPLAGALPTSATQTPEPAKPIIGVTNICAGKTGITYTTTPINGITNYNWSVPVGATVVAGNNTTAITVNFSPIAVSGNVTVKGVGQFCESEPASLAIEVIPAPTGNGELKGLESISPEQTNVTYTIEGLNNVNEYEWLLPAGVTSSNGVTTTINNQITVNFSTNVVPGTITVKGINDCGETVLYNLTFTMASFSISGVIHTEDALPIKGVTVTLSNGTTSQSIVTSETGSYAFTNLSTGNYTVIPTKIEVIKKGEPINGLGIFDVGLIFHLAANNTFPIFGPPIKDTIYKRIAADVDSSKEITDTDGIKLINVINFIDPLTKSWVFVPEEHVFSTPSTPVKPGIVPLPSFPETHSYRDLNKDEVNQNFIGIKIGDVNNTNDPQK